MDKFHLGLHRLLRRKEYIGQIRRLRFSVWSHHTARCCADDHGIEDVSVIRFEENIRDSLIQVVKPNEPVIFSVFQKTVIIVEVASKVFRTDNLDSQKTGEIREHVFVRACFCQRHRKPWAGRSSPEDRKNPPGPGSVSRNRADPSGRSAVRS